MVQSHNPKDRATSHFSFWAAMLISIMANLPIIDVVFHGPKVMEKAPQLMANYPPAFTLLSLVAQLLFTFLFSFLLILYLRKHQWTFSARKWHLQWRMVVMTAGQFLLFSFLMAASIMMTVSDVSWVVSSVATRGLLALVSCVFLTNYMKVQSNREKIFRENEALKESNLQNQIEVLRNQLNPHFLFNTLNTLSFLINHDPAKSQLFLNKLSYILRTSIDLQQNNLISLTEEIKLAEAYFYLLSIRFGGHVLLIINAADPGRYLIPPMTLQMLIENAIKHNVITTDQPLKIGIDLNSEEKFLVISNNLQPKVNSQGGGIGLKNLQERFSRLVGRNPEVYSNDGRFTVSIPLIAV